MTDLFLESFSKPGTADVTPSDRKKLAPLLKHYAKKAKPFTACVRDQLKHGLTKDHANRRCAVIKDLIRGTTKWRGKHLSFDDVNPDALDLLLSMSDEDLVEMYWAADLSLDGSGLEKVGEQMLLDQQETPLDGAGYLLALSQARREVLDADGQADETLHMASIRRIINFDWDPTDHPRDLLGRFREVLRKEDSGTDFYLPDGTHVRKRSERDFDIDTPDFEGLSTPKRDPEDAAETAFKYSAASDKPGSLGGPRSSSLEEVEQAAEAAEDDLPVDEQEWWPDASTKDIFWIAADPDVRETDRQIAYDHLAGGLDEQGMKELDAEMAKNPIGARGSRRNLPSDASEQDISNALDIEKDIVDAWPIESEIRRTEFGYSWDNPEGEAFLEPLEDGSGWHVRFPESSDSPEKQKVAYGDTPTEAIGAAVKGDWNSVEGIENGRAGDDETSADFKVNDTVRHKDSPDRPENTHIVTKVHDDGTVDVAGGAGGGPEPVGTEVNRTSPGDLVRTDKDALDSVKSGAEDEIDFNKSSRDDSGRDREILADPHGTFGAIRDVTSEPGVGYLEFENKDDDNNRFFFERLKDGTWEGEWRKYLDSDDTEGRIAATQTGKTLGELADKVNDGDWNVKDSDPDSANDPDLGVTETGSEIRSAIDRNFAPVDLVQHADGSFSWSEGDEDFTIDNISGVWEVSRANGGVASGDTIEEALMRAKDRDWDFEFWIPWQ